MPFETPTLPETRALSRDFLAAFLAGGADLPPNSRARVLSDDMAGLAFGAYQYIARLSAEFLPDTAEEAFLVRWADIYLGGRIPAAYATGLASFTGIESTVLPLGTQVAGGGGVVYETTQAATIGVTATLVPIRAITPGADGNLGTGILLSLVVAVAGVDSLVTVVTLNGGTDIEDLESLRVRVLNRIQQPPQGGAFNDYEAWAREIPGVTRVWVQPSVFGPGSVGVRFMMDDLRAANRGFPTPADVAAVFENIDRKRPVTVQDLYVGAPVAQPLAIRIKGLSPNTAAVRNAIAASIAAMLRERAAPARAVGGRPVPAQTIYAAWISEAVLDAAGVDHFDLLTEDQVMPNVASLATLGRVDYVP